MNRMTIREAEKRLRALGYELVTAGPWSPGDQETAWTIRNMKTGETMQKTATEIAQMSSHRDRIALAAVRRELAAAEEGDRVVVVQGARPSHAGKTGTVVRIDKPGTANEAYVVDIGEYESIWATEVRKV